MPITINGSGTITGITAGGLPDAIITQAGLLSVLRVIGSNTGSPVDTFDLGSINILYE